MALVYGTLEIIWKFLWLRTFCCALSLPTFYINKEILFFLQNRLPLFYCTTVFVKLFLLHCCVYKVFTVPLKLLLFQQCSTCITVPTKLLLLLWNFNCFKDVSTPICNDITRGDLDLEFDREIVKVRCGNSFNWNNRRVNQMWKFIWLE